MKKAGNLLGTILDLGKGMLITGAEVWRVEDILADVCEAYCFKQADIWVVSSCIQATVQTWDDRTYTQIRSIEGRHYDLDKLDRLYDLAHEICEVPTGVDTIKKRVDEILERPGLPAGKRTLAYVTAAVGFLFFYSGDPVDALVEALIAFVAAYMARTLGTKMNNLLAYNTIAAFVMEAIAISALLGGVVHNLAPVTAAFILMLVSGIGIANGIGNFLHGNTLSGLSETATSILGAAGIAIGITLALLPFRDMMQGQQDMSTITTISNPVLQVITCAVGCSGFALLFGARGKALLFSSLGAALSWIVYLITGNVFGCGYFLSTMAGACFIAFYANVVNLISKIPAAIFLISCLFPLIPGGNLFYTVLGALTGDHDLFRSQGEAMILIALGIALGYITMDVVSKIIKLFLRKYFDLY